MSVPLNLPPIALMIEIEAVSYTHLDVYKRQVPDPQKIEAGVKILAEEVEFAWREQEA